MSNDWWGEPLGAMLSRVLVEELSQRLPQSTVFAETGAVSASPDATIELNVSSGSTRTRRATSSCRRRPASASRGGAGPVTAQFPFCRDAARQRTSQGEVTAISTAVGQLADGLATMLATALGGHGDALFADRVGT